VRGSPHNGQLELGCVCAWMPHTSAGSRSVPPLSPVSRLEPCWVRAQGGQEACRRAGHLAPANLVDNLQPCSLRIFQAHGSPAGCEADPDLRPAGAQEAGWGWRRPGAEVRSGVDPPSCTRLTFHATFQMQIIAPLSQHPFTPITSPTLMVAVPLAHELTSLSTHPGRIRHASLATA
jgi:hypothetical protein